MRTPLDGCSDGYCKIAGPAKGMHTNAGCRCLRFPEDQKAFQEALADLKAERDRYKAALEKIVRYDCVEWGIGDATCEGCPRCHAYDALNPKSNQPEGK